MSLRIVFRRDGQAAAIYDETLNLQAVGAITIRRASHVEPNTDGSWSADLSPVGGPVLGPFALRSQALQAEIDWLAAWLRR
jgi:hypothetical protein